MTTVENTRHIATRLAYALDLPERDTYALLTSTGVGYIDEEWD